MKKGTIILLCALLLCGCGSRETGETVADVWDVPAMAQPREIAVELPGELSVCTMESDAGRLYIGDGYEAAVQMTQGGDLDGTLRSLTGFSKKDLTVLETKAGDVRRYEFVWASQGERGDRLGRGVVLDDGNYHYCLSVLQDVDAIDDCQIIWSSVFHSFSLEEPSEY